VEYAQNGHVALTRLARTPRIDLVIATHSHPDHLRKR
jgi:L-ascorbate metabolism protein UlaG (beta-lactamase superfamily)